MPPVICYMCKNSISNCGRMILVCVENVLPRPVGRTIKLIVSRTRAKLQRKVDTVGFRQILRVCWRATQTRAGAAGVARAEPVSVVRHGLLQLLRHFLVIFSIYHFHQ